MRFGIVDEVIPEPLGAAHRDHHLAAANLKRFLLASLRELVTIPTADLLDQRYEKFRRMGVFIEDVAEEREQRACARSFRAGGRGRSFVGQSDRV